MVLWDTEQTSWEGSNARRWKGFIPGTKDDVETGFMTVDEAKDRCARNAECLAITFRGPAETTEVPLAAAAGGCASWTAAASWPGAADNGPSAGAARPNQSELMN